MIITYTSEERNILARIMRAEALSDGNLGMLMVGNVVVNRVLVDCYTFKDIKTIKGAVYQEKQFAGIDNHLFYAAATTKELELADKVLKGKYYHPATNALWFYSPLKDQNCLPTWYEQKLSGRYKSHCFYIPSNGICREIH